MCAFNKKNQQNAKNSSYWLHSKENDLLMLVTVHRRGGVNISPQVCRKFLCSTTIKEYIK